MPFVFFMSFVQSIATKGNDALLFGQLTLGAL